MANRFETENEKYIITLSDKFRYPSLFLSVFIPLCPNESEPEQRTQPIYNALSVFQPMAVEVFSGDGRNYLLAFQKGVRNKVYQRFLAVVPSLADSSESVSGQRPNTSVEQG